MLFCVILIKLYERAVKNAYKKEFQDQEQEFQEQDRQELEFQEQEQYLYLG